MTDKKISTDLLWNYVSVGVTALCGAAFSIIISIYYPENILGRFNTVYSYYIVLSQLCVCGIHMAIVKYAAEEEGESVGLLLKSIVLTLLISIAVSTLTGLLINCVLYRWIGAGMVSSFNTILVALVLFALNKVFLGWLNGNMRMKAYAFFQAIRNVMIALCLILLSSRKFDGEKLTYCFLFSEIIITLLSVIYLLICIKRFGVFASCTSARELLGFGVRILPSNAIVELNTKIDVICLSIILRNESMVGVYSFAAMFAEGFYQLLMVLRKMINPHIVMEYVKGNILTYINDFKKRYINKIYIMSVLSFFLLIIFYRVLVFVIGKDGYYSGTPLLAIICISIVINTKMIVFGNILSNTGNPGLESIVNVISAFSNAVLNIVLIIIFGMTGAAIATGLSYFVYSIMQSRYVKRKLSVKI